jgi:hypothetical protein
MWGRTVRVLVLVWLMLGMPLSVLAQGYERLGYGRIVNNDLVGDGEDRWQTGSVTTSRVWGPGWYGALPTRPAARSCRGKSTTVFIRRLSPRPDLA